MRLIGQIASTISGGNSRKLRCPISRFAPCARNTGAFSFNKPVTPLRKAHQDGCSFRHGFSASGSLMSGGTFSTMVKAGFTMFPASPVEHKQPGYSFPSMSLPMKQRRKEGCSSRREPWMAFRYSTTCKGGIASGSKSRTMPGLLASFLDGQSQQVEHYDLNDTLMP